MGEKTYGDYENYIEELVKKHKLKKEVFLAEKGDVSIWHANLLHGGERIIKEKKMEIDLSQLGSGIFLIKIYQHNELVSSKKFIKQ